MNFGEGSLRIAMVAACPMPARRGTPLRVERLAQALAARGHDIELITYHLAEEEGRFPFPVRRIYDRVQPGTLPPGPTLRKLAVYDPALGRLVRHRLRARRFDLVHAHHFEGLLAGAYGRRGTGVPLIYDAHTMLDSELPAYSKSWLHKLASTLGYHLDRRIPALADHMIVVTNDIHRRLVSRHGFDPKRISVIKNGVEVESFARGAVDVVPRPELLVYTGTLAPYQGIDLMLQAFARALAVRPRLRLRLLVNTSFAAFQPMAEELGVAHALEIMPDSFDALPTRLAEAAVALLPRVECPGLPQKLLNYMAAGAGIVAFAGSAKLLQHEVNGLIVPDHDIAGFADAIVRLTDDPALAGRLGSAARAAVVDASSWDKAAEHCEEVYRTLLQPRRMAATTRRHPTAVRRRNEQITLAR